MPDGAGLPKGSGTAEQGRVIYDRLCLSCHGPGGPSATAAISLPARKCSLPTNGRKKTIGTFWPYAPTLFDFIRRSKPMMQPAT